ncbi:MAG: GNAT family N-acetyltransferase [Thermoplasmata archaeon]
MESETGAEVASLLEKMVEMPTRRLPMRYYALDRDPTEFPVPSVRLLGPSDAEIVRRSDPLFRSFFSGHGSEDQTLSEGVVAGVIQDGQLASAVTTSAWAGVHVDLGAATIPTMRRLGLATGAAFVVCSQLKAGGCVPVWAAGEPNQASWRIPEKLGFKHVGRREYVVVEGLRPSGYHPGMKAAPGR